MARHDQHRSHEGDSHDGISPAGLSAVSLTSQSDALGASPRPTRSAPGTEIGPNLRVKVPHIDLKLTTTVFAGLWARDPRVEVLTIAGYGF